MKKGFWGKSSLNNKKVISLLLSVYLIIVIVFATMAYSLVTSDIKNELGSKAMLVAIGISNYLDIDIEEFNRLASLDFQELLKDPVNIEFEKKMRKMMDFSEIKYIYLEAPLPEGFVKYKVEKGEEDIYQKEVGTPLNIIYLLDAVLDEKTRLEDTQGKGYVDKDRYNVMLPSFKEVYNNKKPTYTITSDRWGTYITGYAPYYDRWNNYLGLIGVDLVLEGYKLYLRKNLLVIGGFTITFIFIGLYALYLVIRLWRAEEVARRESLLSGIDSLTGLLNRRHLTEYLKQKWEEAKKQKLPISMMIIDVDYFKEYNDNYGHRLGDEILQKIAHVLVSHTREGIDCVARYGGDEFIVILQNTDTTTSEKIANRMIKAVRNLSIQHQHSLTAPYITISIGIGSLTPSEDVTIEDLIDRADEALYYAKDLGRNSVQVWKEDISKNKKIKTNPKS